LNGRLLKRSDRFLEMSWRKVLVADRPSSDRGGRGLSMTARWLTPAIVNVLAASWRWRGDRRLNRRMGAGWFIDRQKHEGPGSGCFPGPFSWLRGLDLNQRPLGYEPNELPGCSTPR
jgi:hypothetical protein